jgi:tetratricopeptide (TPR) repeat protein
VLHSGPGKYRKKARHEQQFIVNPDQAHVDRLIKFHEFDPGNAHLLADLVAALLRQQRWEEARRYLDDGGEPATPRLCYLRSLIAIHDGRFDVARADVERAWAEGEQSHAVRYALGLCRLNTHEPEGTLEILEPWLASGADDDDRCRLLCARAYHHAGRIPEAIPLVEEFLVACPDDPEALGVLTLLQLDSGATDEAIISAQRAIELDPQHFEGNITFGTLALEQFNVAQADRHFDTVLERNPTSGRGWMGKGLAALANNQRELAESCLRKAVDLLPSHLGTLVALGWTQFALGKYAQSEQTFRASIERLRVFAESHAGLAAALFLQDRFEEAEREKNIARRLDPKAVSVQFLEGLFQYKDGDKEKSYETIRRAFDLEVGRSGQSIKQSLTKMQRYRTAERRRNKLPPAPEPKAKH